MKTGANMRPVLNELTIKTAVIDHLLQRGDLDDAVLINEMVVANWSRRADLAVANGKLTAFEIKSDLDTLARLDGQVETYLQRFDKVIVVTTERYAGQALARTAERVGVWVAYGDGGRQRVRIARPGRAVEVKSAEMLCSFLLKTEIHSFVRSQGITVPEDVVRKDLVLLAERCSARRLRDYVLSSLKRRYMSTFAAFMSRRQGVTQIEDLNALSKLKLRLREFEDESLAPSVDRDFRPSHAIDLNLDAMIKVSGSVPEGLPPYILPRRKH